MCRNRSSIQPGSHHSGTWGVLPFGEYKERVDKTGFRADICEQMPGHLSKGRAILQSVLKLQVQQAWL
jgi:hypothetical protein